MKKCFTLSIAVLISAFAALSSFAQEVLKPKIVEKLQQNVFEVVVEKIQDDPLTYEKELPLDRLPYHIRMDKYDSIGTAFLLTDGHFYTAAHVLSLQSESQFTKYFIRSSDGTVYKIGQVLKFATNRDFVVFDAEGFDSKSTKGLQIETNPKLNSTVFAVGNAQGEGIVMRNGLLTSTTPESRNADWQWLRFSAAASPGNSGGPLVTTQGKVIGIVAMKNSSENLNYALPISEVNKVPDNKGIIDHEYYYFLPNIMEKRFYNISQFQMDLPQPLESVRTECCKAEKLHTENLVNTISKDFTFSGKENYVQNDPGNPLLNLKFSMDFPNIICLNEKGKWENYRPQNISTLKLENNGQLQVGSMLGVILSYLEKPDNISVREYIENPKLLMDTLAKAFVLTRNVGQEKITITSYNEPFLTESHTDNLGRTWLISAYRIPFVDSIVYNYALPLPDGILNITTIRSTATTFNGINYDLKFLSDFVMIDYIGTVKEWKEYIDIPEEIYPRHIPVNNSIISFNDNNASIKIGEFDLTCPDNVFPVNDETEIFCEIGYRKNNENKLNLQISGITIATLQNSNDSTALFISKDYKPHPDCPKDFHDDYNELVQKTIPFNGEPFEQDQKTSIIIPEISDDSVTTFGLFYKGSKLDIIKENAYKLKALIK